MLKDNDLIIGPYKLIRELGRGSFGVVWLAERPNADPNHVALKLQLDPNIDLDALLIETTLWARASDHPNVLPFIEARSYDGQVIIVSEYAPDGSLFDWLRKRNGRAPSEKAAIDVTLKILAGLAHLHQRKIIHRDLKPANILMQGSTPRLGDFGLARVLVSSIHGTFNAGTHAYMAPEAFHRVRNEQTDIWSVGVILFELLTGSLPFPQNGVNSFTQLMESVATPLKKIVACALEKDPAKRFRSADEMAESLCDCLKYLYLPVDMYQSIGEWDGELGFPLSDEIAYTSKVSQQNGVVQWFENGCMQWNYRKQNGHYLFGSIYAKWRDEDIKLGFALNSAYTIHGQLHQDFEGGRILLRKDGAVFIDNS